MSRPAVPARALATPLAVLALAAAAAPDARAHAAFLGSTPPPGARAATPPERLTLRFTESLNRRLSDAVLVAAGGGRRVPVRATTAGATLVLAPTRPLRRGAYRVRWRTVSTSDGHELEGSFGFGVQVAAAGGARSIQQSPLAGTGWLRALVRALLYATLLPFAGALLLVALLGRRWLVPAVLDGEPGLDPRAARRRERTLISDLGLFAAALAAAAAAIDAARAAGSLTPAALRDFLLANLSGLGRVAVAGFVLLALALAARRPRAAALSAAAALGALVASGHANSADPRALALAADWAHLLGGSLWLGGIALIALVWGPALRLREGRLAVARHVLPAFGRAALPAFLLVVSMGILNAALELGRVAALWDTAYGAVLLVKVSLVAVIALASYIHALRLRPRLLAANPHPPAALERRHWRLVRAEPLLALGVAAAAGVLVTFPLPPRQLGDAARARAAQPACDPCPLPIPGPAELGVAGQGGSTVVAAWIRREPGRSAGTVRLLDYRGRPSRARARVVGSRPSSCGRGCQTFALAGAPAALHVLVEEAGRTYTATLPATWRAGGAGRARVLLDRAEAAMRGLRSVRELEEITSGPGTFARTRYELRAPDRMAYTTGAGVHAVSIGTRQFFRTAGGPWQQSEADGNVPFRMRGWFRWTPYATAIQLLAERHERGRTLAELALMDPGTPAWTRLTIDEATGRVLEERLVTRARFALHRYFDFNAPVIIDAPRNAIRAG